MKQIMSEPLVLTRPSGTGWDMVAAMDHMDLAGLENIETKSKNFELDKIEHRTLEAEQSQNCILRSTKLVRPARAKLQRIFPNGPRYCYGDYS